MRLSAEERAHLDELIRKGKRTASRPVEAEAIPLSAAPTGSVSPEKALWVTAAELVDVAPRVAQYVPHGRSHMLDASGELGVSLSLWADAYQCMGREVAALAIAIVSTKAQGHFTRSAGGYFAGMLRTHQRGELRTLKKQKIRLSQGGCPPPSRLRMAA